MPKINPYLCTYCNKVYVAKELARCCEMKHEGTEFVRRPEQEPRIN
jgi:hypothetical protein